MVHVLAGPETMLGVLAGACDPFRALSKLLQPLAASPESAVPVVEAWASVGILAGIAVLLWGYTCAMVRIWNPSRHMYLQVDESSEEAEAEGQSPSAARKSTRPIWSYPILWREICTQAYGRKVGIIKVAYVVFAVLCLLWLSRVSPDAPLVFGSLSGTGLVLSLLSLITFILVNAQAVTSLTSERDGQTLELLLVTEVQAQEFVFGKLLGVLFNTKELISIPLLLLVMSFIRGELRFSEFLCVLLSYSVLVLFSAMLGLHAGFSFTASRSAIINSLGTMFFLFVGIFVCMMLIVEARTSFMLQLVPFLGFICGGAFGLWRSLTHHNPSQALTIAAWSMPFLTFYAVVSFLLQDAPEACLAILMAYGGTTIAMLVPAISAFDEALGRTSSDRG